MHDLAGYSLGPSLVELHDAPRMATVLPHLATILPLALGALILALSGLAAMRREPAHRGLVLLSLAVPLLAVTLLSLQNAKVFHPRYVALALPFLLSLLGAGFFDDCGEPRLGERLSALGYTHVVVRRHSAIGEWLAASSAAIHAWPLMADGGLPRTLAFEDSWVLEVKAERPHVSMSAWLGFFPREYEAEDTWRWMAQKGTLRIHTSRASAGTVLELELKAFPDPRHLEWFLNGKRGSGLEVTTEWRRFELPLGLLAPGDSTLALASSRPAIVANDVLHNGDSRSLALAVGRFNFKTVEDR